MSDDLLARAERTARCTPFIEPDAGANETAKVIRDLAAALRAVAELHHPASNSEGCKTCRVLAEHGVSVDE